MQIKNITLIGLGWATLLLVFVACARAGTATTPEVVVAQTEVIHYQPALPDAVQPGSCWTNSVSVPRVDAWRCMIEESQIYDPCFYLDNDDAVVCGAMPGDETGAFKLQLTEPLPAPDVRVEQMTPDVSWALELADGTFCQRYTGATGGVDHKRITFGCVPAEDAGESDTRTVILGEPQAGVVWMAEKAGVTAGPEGTTVQTSTQIAVRTVWQ